MNRCTTFAGSETNQKVRPEILSPAGMQHKCTERTQKITPHLQKLATPSYPFSQEVWRISAQRERNPRLGQTAQSTAAAKNPPVCASSADNYDWENDSIRLSGREGGTVLQRSLADLRTTSRQFASRSIFYRGALSDVLLPEVVPISALKTSGSTGAPKR